MAVSVMAMCILLLMEIVQFGVLIKTSVIVFGNIFIDIFSAEVLSLLRIAARPRYRGVVATRCTNFLVSFRLKPTKNK